MSPERESTSAEVWRAVQMAVALFALLVGLLCAFEGEYARGSFMLILALGGEIRAGRKS